MSTRPICEDIAVSWGSPTLHLEYIEEGLLHKKGVPVHAVMRCLGLFLHSLPKQCWIFFLRIILHIVREPSYFSGITKYCMTDVREPFCSSTIVSYYVIIAVFLINKGYFSTTLRTCNSSNPNSLLEKYRETVSGYILAKDRRDSLTIG